MAIRSDLCSKCQSLKARPKGKIAFVAAPTPILMGKNHVFSPNRTNYFPFSQLILASSLLERLENEYIPWTVAFHDFKSIGDIKNWERELIAYGDLVYGDSVLTKCMIGDGLSRVKAELADYDIVCISANFTFEANSILRLIAIVKEVNPSAMIIIGGRDAAARSEFYLKKGVDVVAMGDADWLLPEFITRLYKGADFHEIYQDGILSGSDLKINLNQLPFLRFDLIFNQKNRYIESGGGGYFESITHKGMVAYFESSRGCSRECDFCTGRLKKISTLSLDRYIQDVAWYKQNNISTLMFSDDNLLLRLNRGRAGEEELITMFEFLRKEKMIWEFPVGLEIGKLVDAKTNKINEPLFKALFWSNDLISDFCGAFRLLFPVENVLVHEKEESKFTYSKLKDRDMYDYVLREMIAAGIPQINLGIMVGWPNETQNTLRNIEAKINEYQSLCYRINCAKNAQIKTKINYSIFCLTPLPGTPLYQQMVNEQRIKYDIEKDPELWSLYTSVLAGDQYEPHEITKIRLDILNNCDSQQVDGKVQLQQIKS